MVTKKEKLLAERRIKWEKELPPKDGFMHIGDEIEYYIHDYMQFIQEKGFEIVCVIPFGNMATYLVNFR